MRMTGWLTVLFIIFGAVIFAPAVKAAPEPIVVFDPLHSACDRKDVPDQPARAFRDQHGVVHLIVSQYNPHANIGPDLLHTSHNCAVIFHSPLLKQPAEFDDYNWLTSFYTADGKNIVSIVHEEFHGGEQPSLCPSRNQLGCAEASIGAAFSTDGGYSFSRAPGPADLIATLPYPYAGDQKVWYGLMNPTNIVFDGRYAYFLVTFGAPDITNPAHPHAGGVCLLRSSNPFDPHSWRAWDGHGFNQAFKDPYIEATSLPDAASLNPCVPVGVGKIMHNLGSVLWSPAHHLYVLSMRCQVWHRKDCAPGAYISTSPDLITWSKAVPILLDAQASAAGVPQLYPSLMDPAATDLNFQDTTDLPWLFTVELDKPAPGAHRRVMAFPVHLVFGQ